MPSARILGIETSCDETSVAIVEDGRTVLSNIIASSVADFAETAGVIPEQAARRQLEFMIPVLERALHDAHVSKNDIGAIAVTKGPGLLGSLLIGTLTARTLSVLWKKPLIGVHHTLGHLSSPWLNLDSNDLPQFPLLTLSVSGGHSDLWLRTSHMKGTLLASTRDDAVGEAFDKGASLLGLPYPGGPVLAKIAQTGKSTAFAFPLPLRGDDTLDFSFSGLKTALRYTIRDLTVPLDSVKADLAASYEYALCEHLMDRVKRAWEMHPEVHELHIVGGVSANTHLRELAKTFCERNSLQCRVPKEMAYCTDNAAMIASAGFFLQEERGEQAYETFTTEAQIPLSKAITAP